MLRWTLLAGCGAAGVGLAIWLAVQPRLGDGPLNFRRLAAFSPPRFTDATEPAQPARETYYREIVADPENPSAERRPESVEDETLATSKPEESSPSEPAAVLQGNAAADWDETPHQVASAVFVDEPGNSIAAQPSDTPSPANEENAELPPPVREHSPPGSEEQREAAPPAETAPPPAPSDEPVEAAVIQNGVSDGKLVIDTRDSDIREVLKLLGEAGGYNILASKNVSGQVTASLSDVSVDEALTAILNSTGYTARREGKFIYVGQPADLAQMDQVRDEIGTRIYRPNYVAAAELEKLITPLLTREIGKATISSPAETGIANDSSKAGGDSFGGAEVVIVRDYLSVLAQVDQIVADVDRRPKQVAIEAMILSVKLDNKNEFGVDFSLLRNASSASLGAGAPLAALANMDFSEGGFKFGFLDGGVGAFIEALETVGETSVVAAPRLMCLNKQRAEILIGAQLGYVSTTVTETAATQSIEFLEVGAQLRLRPFISDDGVIRMEVHPELSTGVVKVEEGLTLPDKEVTQVTTNILCADGRTVIIGGLIREDLNTNITQLPYLGSLPYVGWAFRSKTDQVERRELIVLITPRIVGEPMLGEEGDAAASAFVHRHETYADKMSPIGRRHWSTRYLRLAQAAWAAGDGDTALKNVNLAIHYEPTRIEAADLRRDIVAAGFGDRKVGSHLKEGLHLWQRPRTDYSKQGFPWQKPGDSYHSQPPVESPHDDGVPGPARDILVPQPGTENSQ